MVRTRKKNSVAFFIVYLPELQTIKVNKTRESGGKNARMNQHSPEKPDHLTLLIVKKILWSSKSAAEGQNLRLFRKAGTSGGLCTFPGWKVLSCNPEKIC
jgi:hypothetical protein